jgi:hypothetical protein
LRLLTEAGVCLFGTFGETDSAFRCLADGKVLERVKPSKFPKISIASKVRILDDEPGSDRDYEREQLKRSLKKAQLPAVAHNVADEVKIEGLADDALLVVATRPFPKLISVLFLV